METRHISLFSLMPQSWKACAHLLSAALWLSNICQTIIVIFVYIRALRRIRNLFRNKLTKDANFSCIVASFGSGSPFYVNGKEGFGLYKFHIFTLMYIKN